MASALSRRLLHLLHRRHLSAPATAAAVLSHPLTGKRKSHATLTLLKTLTDPSLIHSTVLSAALNPTYPLDRTALSIAATKLAPSPSLLLSLLTSLAASDPRFRPLCISLLARHSLPDAAAALFASRPDLLSFNSLLSALPPPLSRAAFRDYPRLHNISPNIDSFNIHLKTLCDDNSSSVAYDVLDDMRRRGVKPNATTYHTCLSGFYKEERFGDVARVLEMMGESGWGKEVATYNVRMEGLCKLRRSGEAKALFREMVSAGVKPNWESYSCLVIGFCKEGDMGEAKKIYKEMKGKGCVPGSSFYFTLVYHLCEAEDFGAALGVCREIWARNWVPCFSTMKMLVVGLARKGRVEDAREIVEKMKQKFPKNAELWKEVEDGLPS